MGSSIKTKIGETTKTVVCESCGHAYDYKMQRTGVGTVNSSKFTKAEAQEEAARIAADKLEELLANECDAVACPKCGGLTRAMKKARLAFIPNTLMMIGAGLGLLMVVFAAWLILGKIYIVAALISAGIAFLGVIILIFESGKLLFGKTRQG